MWIKLSQESINLDHVFRVKFLQGWKNNQQYLVAEIESLHNGEIKSLLHYRDLDAELLHHSMSPVLAVSAEPGTSSNESSSHAQSLADLPMRATVSEV
jgi:hypothetical protein